MINTVKTSFSCCLSLSLVLAMTAASWKPSVRQKCNRLVPRYAGYNLPLLYYMLGEKENAISYINQELTKKESQAKRSHECNPLELPHNNSICETPLDREYNEYKEFVKRFMDRIKQ